MSANSSYHVTLNGQGYLLVEGSYRERAQQPFNARFSTGDPSLGDLSYWQFLGQTRYTAEGQEFFDDTTKYRQSSGWDLRDGKPRLCRQIESVSLSASMPAVLSTVSTTLFDDFEAGMDLTTKWNSSYDIAFSPSGVATISGIKGGYNALDATGSGLTCQARGNAANNNNNGLTGYILRTDVSFQATGTWEFKTITSTSAVNNIHAAVLFFGNDSGSYVLEMKGSNMTSWVIKRTTSTAGTAFYDDNDTTVATLVATGGSATSITVKITRDSSGNWEVFENGASLGTFTDNTYTTTKYFGFKVRWAANAPTNVIDDVSFPGAASGVWGQPPKLINYYNALYTPWDSGGSTFAFTTIRSASTASNLPKIVHQNVNDMVVWQRDGSPTNNLNTYLASCNGTTLRAYNGETQVLTTATTIVGTCLIPLSSTKLLVLGVTAANNGIPAIEIVTVDAEAWIITSQVVLQFDGATAGKPMPYACLDSSGALWFATADMSLSLGTQPSAIYYATAADLTATRPTLTAKYTMTDFIIRGLFSFQGSVFMFGSVKRGTNAYASIRKTDGTVVYESTKAISLSDVGSEANFYNHGIPGIWKNLDHVLFLSQTDLDLLDPVLQLDASLNVREVASFESGQFSYAYTNPVAVAEWNGAFYCLNAQAGTVKRTTNTRGTNSGITPATHVLESSAMGRNTSLINKTLYSVTVELSAAVPSSETLTVYVNGTSVGTMVAADGTRKEIVLTSELTSSQFIVKLSWPKASTWTGYLKYGPLLRYIPTQFKKKQWGMGFRATRHLKLVDGRRETATAQTLFDAIKTAWASNVPVTFVDIEGDSYTVIVTDYDRRPPLVNPTTSKLEQLCFVELLEV